MRTKGGYTMRLHDTATRSLVNTIDSSGGLFTMYVCGVTPYDAAHLGHAFTFLTFDLIRRRAQDRGLRVRVVRNVTDVDDPLYVKAQELGVKILSEEQLLGMISG